MESILVRHRRETEWSIDETQGGGSIAIHVYGSKSIRGRVSIASKLSRSNMRRSRSGRVVLDVRARD